MEASDVRELLPIPGRECGSCVVCCYVPNIDTPEFKKPPGVVCANCTGKGCGIYETRPSVCRTFHCGWMVTPDLGEDWRPDRSGVLLASRPDIPTPAGAKSGWQLAVFGGETAIRRVSFVEKVVSLVSRGVPVMLVASGPMGSPYSSMVLNEPLAEAVKKNDLEGALALLLAVHSHLLERAYKPESRNSRGSPIDGEP